MPPLLFCCESELLMYATVKASHVFIVNTLENRHVPDFQARQRELTREVKPLLNCDPKIRLPTCVTPVSTPPKACGKPPLLTATTSPTTRNRQHWRASAPRELGPASRWALQKISPLAGPGPALSVGEQPEPGPPYSSEISSGPAGQYRCQARKRFRAAVTIVARPPLLMQPPQNFFAEKMCGKVGKKSCKMSRDMV